MKKSILKALRADLLLGVRERDTVQNITRASYVRDSRWKPDGANQKSGLDVDTFNREDDIPGVCHAR